ncbi:MAG: hypothetical protein C0466_15430 [Candidatus Accumulibacter sp.]|nr:hypothetical protein [Accumulibacter sp.]
MNTRTLRIALALSLLVNFGVLAAVAYRGIAAGEAPRVVAPPHAFPGLPRYLQLSDAQLRDWHASEAPFLTQLAAGADEIRTHRDRMIREIFSATPDPARIDAERARIAQLQDEQQKAVIRQLQRERELLSPAQRERLAGLLLEQPALPPPFEQLHRD